MEKKESIESLALKFIALLVTVAVGVTLRAYVTCDMWRWFAVPLGAPVLGGMAHAYGLALVFTLFHGVKLAKKNTNDVEPEVYAAPLLAVVGPLVVWGAGAVAHWFMVSP